MRFEVLHELVQEGLVEKATFVGALYDLHAPRYGVQVVVGPDSVWVNIAGVCVLRICRAPVIELDDLRRLVPKVPYPEFCRHPAQCAGRSTCPRDPNCCD